jgi:hypothetical protein
MTELFIVNPISNTDSIRAIITQLSNMKASGKKEDNSENPSSVSISAPASSGEENQIQTRTEDVVILRICNIEEDINTDLTDDTLIEISPVHSMISLDENSSNAISVRRDCPMREIAEHMVNENTDMKMTFTPSFMVLELPSASSVSDISINCFPTKEHLVEFLQSINAKPLSSSNNNNAEWKGKEVKIMDGYTESSMLFTCSYIIYKMTFEKAKELLQSYIISKPITPEYIDCSAPQTSTIYVLMNEPCTIEVFPESDSYTSPVSKQRLLYIYDSIKKTIMNMLSQVVNIRKRAQGKSRSRNGLSGMNTFEYKYVNIPANTNPDSIPTFTAYPNETTTTISLYNHIPSIWKAFLNSSNLELQDKMLAVVNLLNSYGLKMTLNNYSGDISDYTKKTTENSARKIDTPRKSVFSLPPYSSQSQPQPQPRPQENMRGGRGRSRSRNIDNDSDNGGHSCDDGHGSTQRGRGTMRGAFRGRIIRGMGGIPTISNISNTSIVFVQRNDEHKIEPEGSSSRGGVHMNIRGMRAGRGRGRGNNSNSGSEEVKSLVFSSPLPLPPSPPSPPAYQVNDEKKDEFVYVGRGREYGRGFGKNRGGRSGGRGR